MYVSVIYKGMTDKKRQNREVLTFLMNRGPTAYDAFINSLSATEQYTVLNCLKPGACNDNHIALQQRAQQRSNKVFIEPQNFYEEPVNMVNMAAQENRLDIVVKLSNNFNHVNEARQKGMLLYNTTSRNRGLVKIINIDTVTGMKYREGSLTDVDNLTSLFTQMGLKVEVHDNHLKPPTEANIKKAVQEFVTNPYLKTADVAMLFLMSHGTHDKGKDYIFDCDAVPVYLRDIEHFFHNDICVYMQNKPKMMFVQACRGKFPDYGTRRKVETDSHVHQNATTNQVEIDYMPTRSDFLLAHSTCVGTASHRDTYVGTWFIYLICKVFMTHAHNTDVEEMLKLVYESLKVERTSAGEMQTGELIIRTFRRCFLNPGIYWEGNQLKHF